jgi:hypothetical protein
VDQYGGNGIVMIMIRLIWSWVGHVEGICENGAEISGPIKVWLIFE